MKTIARSSWLALLVCAGGLAGAAPVGDMAKMFVDPPEETKPWCYWYWLNGDVTADGITKDLTAMAKVGIKRAMIGNIEGGGPVKMLSPEWNALTHHAFKEAGRLGVDLMMFNGPGWSQSGGPWIKPEQSMRRVTWYETPVKGGKVSQKVRPEIETRLGVDPARADAPRSGLPVVQRGAQDIAVLAVPRKPAVAITGSKQPNKVMQFTHSEPFKARALVIEGAVDGKLFAVQDDGQKTLVAEIRTGGSNPATDFLPEGIETFSFKEATARQFVLEPCELDGAKVTLTSEPKVAQVIEKQLGRMHPNPSPTWTSYVFPASVEPDDPATVIQPKEVLNLTGKMNADGVLNCELPAGDWTILYFGMVTTGRQNTPAAQEATGLEVDKLSKVHVEYHFNSMIGKLLKEMTPAEKAAFKGITVDSYEVGAQNWTDNFGTEFKRRNGYDPVTLLPVFTGRVVESAKKSDQFLWDLRRTVADMVAENYVGGLRDLAHKQGMMLWCENYGHWGFPAEFLNYGRYADEIGGEFWTNNPLGTIECRAASSSSHIFGKQRVFAEAFTSSLDMNHQPYTIKARGEELFCEGINQFVLHVYTHQPRDGVPGKNTWFGTPFHRNTPWFNQGRDWVKYLQRVHYMLQQGEPVADVAVYIGDFAPQMTGPANPVPAGYDYDYLDSEALLTSLKVVDGEWVVYDEKNPRRISTRYQLIAMPDSGYIRPQVQRRLEAMKKAGGKTLEAMPVTAEQLQQAKIAPLVAQPSCPVRWKVRRLNDGMMFFLSNFGNTGAFEATLRVAGKVPELYNPATGEITRMARYRADGSGTRITIDVKDRADSFFVVFRSKQAVPSVVKVQAAGKDIPPGELALSYDRSGALVAESSNKGEYALTLSNGTERKLVIDKDAATLAIPGPWQSSPRDTRGHTALLETSVTVPQGFGDGRRVYLDLGNVTIMAKVKLNGKDYETRWMPPFVVDVTDGLQAGANKLQVLVTSTSQGKPKLGDNVSLKAVPVLVTP